MTARIVHIFLLVHCFVMVSSFHLLASDRRRRSAWSQSSQLPTFVQRQALPSDPTSPSTSTCRQMIGTGFNFDDGDQILVSAQKPLGIILEEKEEGGEGGGCVVAEFADATSAVAKAGVEVGDWLQAVNNADVSQASIEEVMQRIIAAPKVVNLRFQRPWRERE